MTDLWIKPDRPARERADPVVVTLSGPGAEALRRLARQLDSTPQELAEMIISEALVLKISLHALAEAPAQGNA
ncbi:hypothetical protein [Salinarimonas soli]|uniref:CopG family transcriptional regulator n=1 Tax=Salinarimonas soli TaxID=1638099 RepID=A0A5B2VGQ9_9HYPH|nr:hypothetical protein [Salinarimonas soli]KAA2237700.1 hypothetical protein F0L46_08455 [Salinarimonas soli]